MNKKIFGILVCILLIGISIFSNVSAIIVKTDHNWKIEDDYSFPQIGDYDYGISNQNIHNCALCMINNLYVGKTITIKADIHNYGLCFIGGGWGWYSSNGRSCWVEWDFNYPTTTTVDISYRCWDDVTVDWRVELDGAHLASPSVPGVGSKKNWKIVTIEDVDITAGPHTLFLGTYQMDYYPDYHVDWVKIGDLKIEAESYNRMGGNDPNPDLRGVSIVPGDINVQLWNGNPFDGVLLNEDFVGNTNTVIDNKHQYSGNTYLAHYIENNGVSRIEYEYTVQSIKDKIFVIIDPDDTLNEINEDNNFASKKIFRLNQFNNLFERFLQRFPLFEKILNQIT